MIGLFKTSKQNHFFNQCAIFFLRWNVLNFFKVCFKIYYISEIFAASEVVNQIELIKHLNAKTAEVGIQVKMKRYDQKAVNKIQSFDEKFYNAELKSWFVGIQHIEELRNFQNT